VPKLVQNAGDEVTSSNNDDRMNRVDAGGHEETRFLPVSEGEHGHVVRLLNENTAAGGKEALDIVLGWWEAGLVDASTLTDRRPGAEPDEGAENEESGQLDRARASDRGEAGEERWQAFVRRNLSRKRKPFFRKKRR